MTTQFKCGIYDAVYNECGSPKWFIRVNHYILGIVEADGLTIQYTIDSIKLCVSDMLEICLLMSRIEKQFKQLN